MARVKDNSFLIRNRISIKTTGNIEIKTESDSPNIKLTENQLDNSIHIFSCDRNFEEKMDSKKTKKNPMKTMVA